MNTDLMARFAHHAEDQLIALHDQLLAGQITTEQFVALAFAFLRSVIVQGVALADVGVAADLTAATGTPVPTIGPPPDDLLDDLTTSVVTAIFVSEAYKANATKAIATEARAAALAAVHSGTFTALATHRDNGIPIIGWTRVLNTGACELCQDLAGQVLPVDAEPYHHKGCGCSTRPVTEKENDQ